MKFLLISLIVTFSIDCRSQVAANDVYYTVYSCEHSGQDVKPKCNAGSVIIQAAMYGRLTRTICQDEYNRDTLYDCWSQNSESVVIDRCNGKNSCSVAPSNAVFGDPCPGTIKYLEVTYSCT